MIFVLRRNPCLRSPSLLSLSLFSNNLTSRQMSFSLAHLLPVSVIGDWHLLSLVLSSLPPPAFSSLASGAERIVSTTLPRVSVISGSVVDAISSLFHRCRLIKQFVPPITLCREGGSIPSRMNMHPLFLYLASSHFFPAAPFSLSSSLLPPLPTC